MWFALIRWRLPPKFKDLFLLQWANLLGGLPKENQLYAVLSLWPIIKVKRVKSLKVSPAYNTQFQWWSQGSEAAAHGWQLQPTFSCWYCEWRSVQPMKVAVLELCLSNCFLSNLGVILWFTQQNFASLFLSNFD